MNNFGFPDESFIRGNIPMTKSEIRALTLLKLGLTTDDIVWDIGAGTGSISIEAALNLAGGQVLAIEKNEKAIELIETNKKKFNCYNLQIIHGTAPEVFERLLPPTKAIIGGSGGRLEEILNYLWYKTNITSLVINAVTLNTANLALEFLNSTGADWEAIQVGVNRIKMVNNYQMLQAQNPIFIIAGKK